MTTFMRRRRARVEESPSQPALEQPDLLDLDIHPSDPIVAFFQSAPGPVDIDTLRWDSPALDQLREQGVKLVVPLVAQGELIGLLNLGPRLSEQEYSTDDRKLLASLAAQAAPAVRVAQLVRQQEAAARDRERIEQELRVATLVQQNFLPHSLPELPGWDLAAFYRPAREMGGDFYDFIDLSDGLVGVVCADVTDKGVPAALVMSAARTLLRATARRLVAPGEVLERVNDVLAPDMPSAMFVTCLYMVLDPATGHVRFANAGHNLPYLRCADGAVELRATGMPLGLLEGSTYEEKEATLSSGDCLLLHSDGLAEAHDAKREMFGCARLRELLAASSGGGQDVIDLLLAEYARHVPPGADQEDDITLVTLRRVEGAAATLDEFSVPSVTGNERDVAERVVRTVEPLGIDARRLERLRTAVAEAAMNAIEHGNRNDPDLPVGVTVARAGDELAVRIVDHGGDTEIPSSTDPDIGKKISGEQPPRGWGLFLIKNMVDDLRVSTDGEHHVVELVVHLRGG